MNRRFVTAFAVIGALATIGHADLAARAAGNPQTPPSANTASATRTGQILGHVVDAATGTPIDDAIVLLGASGTSGRGESGGDGSREQTSPPRILVDGRGQFEFRNLPASAITITAAADGYLDGGVGARTPGGGAVPIQLAAGQRLTDVTIRLWKCAVIGGAIFDESDEPVAGASVRLLRRTVGARRLVRESETTTDDRGAFRFSSLAPGRYVVVVPAASSSLPVSVADEHLEMASTGVSALVRGPVTAVPQPSEPGFRVGDALLQPLGALARSAPAPGADGRVLVYRTTFYPGVAAASQAQDVEVAAGDDRSGIDITLSLVPTVSVSGSIVSPGDSMAYTKLRLVPNDSADLGDKAGFETAWALTDADGQFSFLGVPPGEYTIEGNNTGPAQGGSPLWVRHTISIGDAPVAGLTLTARGEISVSGRLAFDGSSPRPTGSQLKSLPFRLLPEDSTPETSAAMSPLGDDGRIWYYAAPAGRYWVDLRPDDWPAAWTLASITSSGRDFMKHLLDLESDVTDLIITFTDRPTEISGAIQSSGGQNDQLDVVVFPNDYAEAADEGMLMRRSRVVGVDSGHFIVKGLPSGNYLIAAISPSEEATWARPDVLKVIAAQATPVSLADRGRVTVDVKPVVFR